MLVQRKQDAIAFKAISYCQIRSGLLDRTNRLPATVQGVVQWKHKMLPSYNSRLPSLRVNVKIRGCRKSRQFLELGHKRMCNGDQVARRPVNL